MNRRELVTRASSCPDTDPANWLPCARCYGATMWSGVRRLVVAGEGPELEELTLA